MINQCGFDIYPRLDLSVADKGVYQAFLDEVIRTYRNARDERGHRADGKVLQIPSMSAEDDDLNIRFMIGECPHLPYSSDCCNYFLRFSSKNPSWEEDVAEPYIRGVHTIALKHLGTRVHFWHAESEPQYTKDRDFYANQQVLEAKQILEGFKGRLIIGQSKAELESKYFWEHRHSTAHPAPVNLKMSLPSFENLPESSSIDARYHHSTGGIHHTPRIHWCFLAEIVEIEESERTKLLVRDQDGMKTSVWFYADNRGFDIPAEMKQVGHTVAILYAHQQTLQDSSQGIRIDTNRSLQILPTSLEQLLALMNPGEPTCVHCGATQNLFRCPMCRVAHFCSNQICFLLAHTSVSHMFNCILSQSWCFYTLSRLVQEDFEFCYNFSTCPGLGNVGRRAEGMAQYFQKLVRERGTMN